MARLQSGTRIYGTATVDTILFVNSTATAVSTSTGALVVAGGAGFNGNIYFNGNLYQNGALFTSGVSTGTTSTFFINNNTQSTSTNTGALVVAGGVGVGGNIYAGGALFAVTKSFLIEHPTKPGMKLRYGSLEGPENGVYVRGRLKGTTTIELPDYWSKLVDPESVTVQITPIGRHQKLFVQEITNNQVIIENDALFGGSIDCYYVIFAERADTDKLAVEIPG